MSDSTMGPPRPPRPPPAGGTDALAVTLRVGERAVGARVQSGEGELVPDAPVPLRARRERGGWVLEGPQGTQRLGPRDAVEVTQGAVSVRIAPVRQARFSRLHLEQGDVVLPVIMLATTVLVLQIGLLAALFSPEEGGAQGWEPTPEYIARLLEGQYDGKERGVIAPATDRPKTGDTIDSFYLQPGHDGPRDRIGGGSNLGEAVRDGEKEGAEARRKSAAPKVPAAGEDTPTQEPPAPQELDEAEVSAEATEGEAEEDRPIAVHVDEGWGFTDWYDTQDARQDAREIERQLKLARDILRLDPDNPAGLSTRAYYEYLAMDFEAATRTYERFTALYPESSGGWNNLALVYKRLGQYEKEEEYYRIALTLDPADPTAMINLAVNLGHQGRFDEALAWMDKAELLEPDNPYAELHRAKIYAEMGKEERAYRHLQKSLAGMRKLDTLHSIEFRQDIRLDPAFAEMREQERFRKLLDRFYGDKQQGWWNTKKKAP